MPSIRPSRLFSRSMTASRTAGLRKKAVMNLAEPSGSSPPEKPPGMTMIWLFRAACANRLDRLGHVLRRSGCSSQGSPRPVRPARTARAVSYSQLVPGNTGISDPGTGRLHLGGTRAAAGAGEGPATGVSSCGGPGGIDRLQNAFVQLAAARQWRPSSPPDGDDRLRSGSTPSCTAQSGQSSVSSATMAPGTGRYQSRASVVRGCKADARCRRTSS